MILQIVKPNIYGFGGANKTNTFAAQESEQI